MALSKGFFATLPTLDAVPMKDADIAWLVYDLVHDKKRNVYSLERDKVVYTKFNESLEKITRSEPGDMNDFVGLLQEKVNEKLDGNPPDTETIDATF